MKRSILLLILTIATILYTCAEVLTLRKTSYRAYTPVHLSNEFKKEIKEETKGKSEYDIVVYCNDKTQKLLTFSTKCETFDDRKITKMHCVGYARVFATICNYAFSVNGKKGNVKPVVGQVYINGINLNDYSKLLPTKWKNFTKDHDFAEVTLSDKKIIYVDPSLDIIQ